MQYIGSKVAPRRATVEELFPIVANILQFPSETRFLVFDETRLSLRPLDATAPANDSNSQAVHLIFQIPVEDPFPQTNYEWTVPKPETEGDQPPIRAVKFGYPTTVDKFLEGGVEAIVYDFDHPDEPVFEASFPPEVKLADFKQFLACELGWLYNPEENSIAIYKNTPGEKAPGTLPIEEFQGFGLTAQFSSNATLKYMIWVERNERIPEDVYRRSQVFVVNYQAGPSIPAVQHRLLMEQNPTVGEVISALETVLPARVQDVSVYRVLNHSIESRLQREKRLFHGDNVLFVAESTAFMEAPNEKVLRAVHAQSEGGKLKLGMNPFFITVTLSEKIPDFQKRLQEAIGATDEDFKNLYILIGLPTMRFVPRLALHGDGLMSDALAAQGGVADPHLFIVRLSEGKGGAGKGKHPSLKRHN
jgi:hypothetical protein